ncbi:MAG: CoA activase [Dehalococcoidia bacterium]|nr:MAG: CoA activase [Dehalococcoidia bacterium]
MAERNKRYMGIDIGSVSLNIAIIDEQVNLLKSVYQRTKGQPVTALLDAFNDLIKAFPVLDGVVATGSGRDLVAEMLGVDKENEILTQGRAATYFHPEVRTVIEIGGQDSKLIFLEQDERTGKTIIVDHALNEICAAGTGSFLDQQAYRLGVSIDKEFGALALKSERPATIAGRCSVFAKSDMVHLQQEGVPKEDIVAGLCYALARNYISNLGKGKQFIKPVAFQGGVAANQGVARAFEDLLELEKGELIIPEHFFVTGALGSAIIAKERETSTPLMLAGAIKDLEQYLAQTADETRHAYLKRLHHRDGASADSEDYLDHQAQRIKVYLGIDVGAASTNIVILDENRNLLRKRYLMTEGEPIESVKKGLMDIVTGLDNALDVRGVGVTGSGRYFVGDFIGADVVVNEITAQARATIEIDSTVDTIFEIGGQDSKYISLKNGSVVDFEMNKVCAAGTGSFLQEQATRLDVKLDDFSKLAFDSASPADLGTRCTVFMESDLIHHQQVGSPKVDLVAGLSYSIAYNYVEKVIGNKKIGDRIYFQGGVATNRSVASAYENLLGKQIIVPQDHNVTGAIGAALIAQERQMNNGQRSSFVGFELGARHYEVKTFECMHCPNHCEVKRVLVGGNKESFYGGICDRYEIKKEEGTGVELPDLFREREELLLRYHREDETDADVTTIGMPRMLMFYEQFPLWGTFFQELGLKVVLSDKTNRRLINKGLQLILAEMCYPVKVAYGHVENLIEKDVDYVFLPNVIDLEMTANDVDRSYNCPYIQGIPFMIGPAFEDRVKILKPTIYMAEENYNLKQQMVELGQKLGKTAGDATRAADAAIKAQNEFQEDCQRRGREVLESLSRDNEAVVVIGKPYNAHDIGLNLNIPKKLRKLGVLAIPFDLLPLDSVQLPSHYSNLVWKNEQNLLRAAMFARDHRSLNPVLITNYGCGPDAFFMKYLEDTMGPNPCLVLEVDEHSADAGIATRVEAFVDTSNRASVSAMQDEQPHLHVVRPGSEIAIFKPSRKMREFDRTIYVPYLSGHSDVFAAALRSAGIDARVLPRPDERSDELGRRYASSKECHPYQLLTGDLVRMTELEGFDPDRSAFFTLSFDGSCRMSQYPLSFKLVLKRLGLSHMPVVAPSTSIRLDEGTRLFGLNWARSIWKGWLATDILLAKLLRIRPYEINEGETERVYEQAIEDICAGLTDGSFPEAFKRANEAMDRIPRREENRPIIGIVGEFYTCMNSWSNNEIIRELESHGAEVKFGPTTTDFVVYFEHVYPAINFAKGKYLMALYYYLRRTWDIRWQRRIESMLGEELYPWKIPPLDKRIEMASPYVSPEIDPTVTINVSKAEGYAVQGCSGIANLIVLNCVFGSLATAIYKKVKKERNGIPLLTMIYDGLKQTNEKTRIEAFVHQVKSYHERYGSVV